MKKTWLLYLFILGFILGTLAYLGALYYAETERLKEVEREDRIGSLDEFISLIRFYDGSGITMKEAEEGFYYGRLLDGSDLENGILQFKPKRFYSMHVGQEERLRDVLSYLAKSKHLLGISFYEESELPALHLNHNQLHLLDGDEGNTFLQIKSQLEKKFTQSSLQGEEMIILSYIYNLEGNYEKSDRLDRQNCKKNKLRCRDEVEIRVKGSVRDENGAAMDSASLYVLNDQNRKPYLTDENGNFDFIVPTKTLEKIRIKAIKKGFAEGYNDFYVVSSGKDQERSILITINKAHGSLTLDTETQESPVVVEKGSILNSVAFETGMFVIETPLTTYRIPRTAIVQKQGSIYKGKVDVYVYEFNKSSVIPNLLQMDVLSTHEEKIFMESNITPFEMPYIQFFAKGSDEELFIKESNPIQLTSRIIEKDLIRSDSEKVYPAVTSEDIATLVSISGKRQSHPISRKYLIENKLSSFPTWWIIDRKRGLWDSVPVKVLNEKGTVETVYYSIGTDVK